MWEEMNGGREDERERTRVETACEKERKGERERE